MDPVRSQLPPTGRAAGVPGGRRNSGRQIGLQIATDWCQIGVPTSYRL